MQVGLKQVLKLQQSLDESFDEPVTNDSSRERESNPGEEASTQEAQKNDAKEVTLEKKEQSDNTPEIDWEAYAESYSYLPPGAGSGRDFAHDDLPGYDQTLTRAETLEEHLLWQVRMSDMNGLEVQIAVRLIGEMNDDGFLDASPVMHPPEPVPEAEAEAEASTAHGTLEDDDGDLLADGPSPHHTPAEPAMLGVGSGEGAPVADLIDDDGLLADGPSPDASSDGAADLLADGPQPTPVDAVEAVAEDLEVPVEWVDMVRHKLMTFDPVGCLARDLRECLLVQLELWGYDDECLAYNLVHDFMHDVENRNYQAIAKALKVPMAEIGDAMKIIEALEPRPARNYLPREIVAEQQYITPDVYVHKLVDEYIISLNEDGLPKLKVSQFYLDKLKSAERGDPSKSYIKEKMRSATWLIRSIHQRQRTIYKVVESILKFQRDWFDEKGPLRPLILKEVADDIEMHESTVSRVTSRKYLHCHRGIFELKYFFNSSIATKDGSNIASESVKDEIKKIVADENPKKPYSDAAIVKLLKEQDIDIARRTVAKYREMLGILPSNKRKQVF
jgi:RNA polymerase sigma-54 factor